jgi:Pentapeptide repeats (8 copies)
MGVLCAAGSASAASRGYLIHNYADSDLRVVGATPVPADPGVFYHFGFEGRPHDEAVLKARDGVQDWQLKYELGRSYAARLLYKMQGTDGSVAFRIQTSTTSNDSTCEITGVSGYFCTAEGLVLSVRKGGPKCLAAPADRVDWSGCDKRQSNLGEAHLQRADLRRTNLSSSFLGNAELQHADLNGADLRGAGLEHAQLEHADLKGADLRGAGLEDAQLQNADLTALDLSGTSLIRANLGGANLTGVKFFQYSLYKSRCNSQTTWPDGTRGHGNACPTQGVRR